MSDFPVPEKDMNVTTVGDLRKALADEPDDMPVEDAMGEALLLTWWKDKKTIKRYIEIS